MKGKRIALSIHSWWNIAHNSHLPLLRLSVSLFNFFHLDLENTSVICYFCNEMLIYASLCWQHYPALSLQGSAGCQSPETPRWCWTIRDCWPFLPLQWKNYLKAKATVEITQVRNWWPSVESYAIVIKVLLLQHLYCTSTSKQRQKKWRCGFVNFT